MILDKVKGAIRKYNLISKGDLVLVAVSGGADSVCLLYLLKGLSRKMSFRLHVAHLDHMLRRDSGRDVQFVDSLTRKLKLPITIGRLNVRALDRKGSLEEVAREARLDFLFKVAKGIGAEKIALAHNLDDQAETVLMRLLRGTGLLGLSGISPKRNFQGFTVIRPLIGVQRREIKAFLNKRGVDACIDKTNLKNIYFRNKVRNNLIPLLEKEYNPNVKELLSNMAEMIALDYDYLEGIALRLVKGKPGLVVLSGFLKLHPAIQRLVLRLNIAQLQGSTRRISYQHIREIEDLIFNRPKNSIVDLPKGISVVRKAKNVVFYHR